MLKVKDFKFKNVKKRGVDDEYTVMTIETAKETFEFRIEEIRHFTEKADDVANYKEMTH